MFAKHGGGVTPFNRLGFQIALSEVVHHPDFQFMDIGEVTRGQHLALQRREDDLDLIQPGGIDRQPVDADLEWKFQRPDPAPDLLGGMGGAVVQDQVQHPDAFCPQALEDHPEEHLELHEPLPGEAANHRLSGVDEQPGKQMQHSLAHISGSVAHRRARLGGIDPTGSHQGLYAGLLIRADDDLSPLSQSFGSLIQVQNNRGLSEELRVGRLLPGVPLPGLDLLLPQPSSNGGGRNV